MPLPGRPLTEKQIEYCRIRATDKTPEEAYSLAGYSMNTDFTRQIAGLEGQRPIQDKIDEFAGRPPRVWGPDAPKPISQVRKEIKQARRIVKEAIDFAPADVIGGVAITGSKVSVKKVRKEDIEQKLWDLHESAIAAGDRATARQCLVDLGKEKGMFTPTQKIRFETVEDLTDDQLEKIMKKFMADESVPLPPPVEQEDGSPEPLVN